VNTTTAGFQSYASVAVDDTGNFIVVWSGNGVGDNAGIFVQRFDSSGVAQGGETLANTTTTGTQQTPSVSVTSNGDFVVVWSDTSGIFGQRFNSAGALVGGEFAISINQGSYARVSTVSDGSFIVAWQNTGQDSGATKGIYLRRFDNAGTALTGEVLVNTTVLDDQVLPSIDINRTGEFVIAWRDKGQVGGIYAQLYNADASTRGTEIQVADAVGITNYPQVAIDNNGDFVVTYEDSSIDGDDWGIVARRFDRNGVALSSELLVNSTTLSGQEYPSIATSGEGQFVIVWTDWNTETIESRRFGAFTSENGDAAIFDVALKEPPTADVTISLALPDGTEGLLSTTSLTFTASDWDAPQTVTVTGLDDVLSDGDIVYTVVVNPAISADANYQGMDAEDVTLVNLDNDPVLDLDVDDSVAVGVNYATNWIEGSGAVLISDTDATLTDPDSVNLTQLTVSISNPFDGVGK